MRTGITSIVIVMTLTGLAGCSSSHVDSAAQASDTIGTRVPDDFAAKALEVCQAALEDKQGWAAFPVQEFDPTHPDPEHFAEVAGWLRDEVAPTFEVWSSDLKALGEPDPPEAWDQVLAAVDRIAALNADQIDAAEAGDAAAFATATAGLQSTQVDLEAATHRAGVDACAEVHAA